MSTEAQAPAESAAASVAPSAPADSGAQTQPASSAPPAEGQDNQTEADLSELHPAVRESIERRIQQESTRIADEKMRAEYAEKWSWLPKEKREAFAKDRKAFSTMEERAARAEALERENAELRQARQRPEPQQEERPVQKTRVENTEENLLADLEKGYELDESDRKFYRGVISKAEERGFQKAVAYFNEQFDKRFDDRLSLHEDIKTVRSDPKWSDAEIGDALQFTAKGIYDLAKENGKPMTWQQAKNMALGLKAFQPKAEATQAPKQEPAKPVAPPPTPKQPPRLGDNGTATKEGGGVDIDVYNEDQLRALFHNDPNVKSHFAR